MTDDIVTRLRDIKRDAILMWDEQEAIDIAADEIERLRKERDRWRKLAKSEHWLRVPDHIGCDCYERAVRGD